MINSTSHINGYNRTDALAISGAKHAPTPKTDLETGDRLSSGSTDSLRAALENSPEVRPEVVERARRLAVDPNYPPRELIERLSKLILSSNDPAE